MAMADAATGASSTRAMTGDDRRIIFASSLGTVFEWYDFYLYGSLAASVGRAFFSAFDANTQFIFALLAFSAGFLVRPFGALVFGRLGDMIGRKYTFLVTIVIMGLSTFVVGLLPGYPTLGWIAPVILITLRLLQGLALGGEYGGAATYVAEHAPQGRRGFYTSWIQTTATLGLFLSLIVILAVRNSVSTDTFNDWGWRIPFLLSILLLAASVWIRLQMDESPAFARMKAEGRTSKAPLTEAFGHWPNAKLALLALFGLTAGQAVVWYGGQFYSRIFLGSIKVDANTTDILVSIALAIGTLGFLFFGWLSDKIGRKPIILGGCLLAAVTYFPAFGLLTHYANPALENALVTSPVTLVADPADCSVLFDPVGGKVFKNSCDIAKQVLIANAVNHATAPAPAGTVAKVRIGTQEFSSFNGNSLDAASFATQRAAFAKTVGDAAAAAGYPRDFVKPETINKPMTVVVLTYLVLLVTMVYGPIAAALVELFPTRIRYSAMSLPYHIGNGWFGGLLPPIVVAIVASTGNIYAGLWYPIGVAALTFVIGLLFIPETRSRDIYAND